MSFLIAAAGTGGHVFPGLSVGEALIDLGIPRRDILYVGGDRLEARVYPREGFPFLGLTLRGLRRSMSPANLTLPLVVLRARARILEVVRERTVGVILGMGGYVTIPTALAARKTGIPLFLAEQNAVGGLANRIAARWARRVFVSFPHTGGLEGAEWVGNPVREVFWEFDRATLLKAAMAHYGLTPDTPVLGVFGGSLGAGAINETVARMVTGWDGEAMQVVHLTGESHLDAMRSLTAADTVVWRRVGFEPSMENFYAVADLVVARAGGAVAELTATATPSILVPGEFGATGHQAANARFLTDEGAAITLSENELGSLSRMVRDELFDRERLEAMTRSAQRVARPTAARAIARAMIEAHR